jgi:Icc-related predicted phosphoesterase
MGGPQPTVMMNILALADLHFHRPWYDWVLREAALERWDLVLVAGDLLDQFHRRCGMAEQVAYHLEWFERMAATGQPLAVCAGNHDANDAPLAIVTNETLPEILTRAFLEERWMDAARGKTTVVDGEDRRLETRRGPIFISALTWRWGGETMSRARPHPDDTERLREARERARSDGLPWLLLAHDPPAPSCLTAVSHENAARILVQVFRPDLCVSGHLHEAPFESSGGFATRIGPTLCVNPGHRAEERPAAVVLEATAEGWEARRPADRE